MTETAQKNIWGTAAWYEHYLVPVLFDGPAREVGKRLGDAIGDRVLETAAGTGILTRHMLRQGRGGGDYIATDISPSALEIAERECAGRHGLSFQVSDAMQLPFEDRRFDSVVCQFGLMLMPDRLAACREAFRVLRPGGCFAFTVWDGLEHNRSASVLNDALAAVFPEDPPVYYQAPYAWHRRDVIAEHLVTAGFTHHEMEVLRMVVPISNPDAFAMGFLFGTQFSRELAARNADPVAVHEEIATAFRQHLNGRTTLQFILVTAWA